MKTINLAPNKRQVVVGDERDRRYIFDVDARWVDDHWEAAIVPPDGFDPDIYPHIRAIGNVGHHLGQVIEELAFATACFLNEREGGMWEVLASETGCVSEEKFRNAQMGRRT